jgi:hypothetical protein
VLASARPTRRDALTGVDRVGAQAEAILLTVGGLTAVALSWKRDREWVASTQSDRIALAVRVLYTRASPCDTMMGPVKAASTRNQTS